MVNREPEKAKREVEIKRLLYAEFRADYRYRTFENWLIAQVVKLRKPAAEIASVERGRVLAELETWILQQMENPD